MSLGGGDLQVILRRIRHGFIICDDTEFCDKIISEDVETEQRRRNLAKSKSIDMEKIDLVTLLRTEQDFILDELSHSPEWTATNVQVRRVRCETLGRLDEIKTENEAKRKVQIISWQDPTTAAQPNGKNSDEINHSETNNLDDDSNSSLFQRRNEPIIPLTKPSPLTLLLQSTKNKQNPYSQYAKFDGTPNISSNQSKKFTVHFKSQKQKLLIIVSSQATVEETIGYVCYKYTIENREPSLTQKDPSKYSLCIADDDGAAEDDFPPLTNTRPIGQYDFPHLCLIELATPSTPAVVSKTVEIASGESDDDDDDVYDDSSVDDSSRSATPPLNESSRKTSSLPIVQDFPPAPFDPIDNLNRLYESLNQKTYQFDYYYKIGSTKTIKIRIDVSGEQIRFELLEKHSRLPWQNMSLSTQHLVDCSLLDKDLNKRRDRTRVYLRFDTQQESDGTRIYQTYEYDTTIELAEQFREQILNIIKLKNPQGRDLYEQQQQRRDNTRKRRSIFNIIGGGLGGNSGSSSKS